MLVQRDKETRDLHNIETHVCVRLGGFYKVLLDFVF